VSSRHTRSFFGVMLAVVFALSAVVVAPASAKLTKHQKAHIRKQLKRAIKKNPKLIRSKHFIKKASLVDFTLPVTIKLRGGSDALNNPNSATIDLGASLGTREIDLGGTLPAQIKFHDSFDGGALGNVDLEILPSTAGGLTTTAIPLLWNPDTTTSAPETGTLGKAPGCAGFNGGTPLAGLFHDILAPGTSTSVVNPAPFDGPTYGAPGFPTIPGVDSIAAISASKATSNPNALGGQVNPFPSVHTDPQYTTPPTAGDTVLRTAPITLGIANPGDEVPASGVEGTDTVTIGKSGGEANLFGDIPGKGYGIDVTVSLAGQIHSILREVDPDPKALHIGDSWSGAAFNCRQAYTGGVQNYIPGVKLQGDLRISPAIMANGDLRIAKATLTSLNSSPSTRIALAACLAPYETFAETGATLVPAQPNSDTTPVTVPVPPINPGLARSGPPLGVPCNAPATQLVQDANVGVLDPANTNGAPDGFTTDATGAKVSVSGDLHVVNVSADIMIGNGLHS
jgi:hypothetical protein